MEPLS